MKTCFKCGALKSLDDFYKHPMMADGHVGKCKECNKADVIANRLKNSEYYREYDTLRANLPHRVEQRKEYAKTPEGIAALRAGAAAWVGRNPRKRAAEILFGNYIRSRKHLKQPCEVCASDNVHGHHEDYNKPMEVRWLCPLHHSARHKEMRRLGIKP